MRAFRRRRGYYVADLEGDEATILSRVVADTALLLGEQFGGDPQDPESQDPQEPDPQDPGLEEPPDPLQAMSWSPDGVAEPSDPALARLLPNASWDDEEINAEFRRLTESDLRRAKIARLRMVWHGLRQGAGELRVPIQDGMDWAAALNDVRLVISERLQITTEEDAEAVHQRAVGAADDSEEEVREALGMVYSALGWLQESLVQVMLPTLGDHGAPE